MNSCAVAGIDGFVVEVEVDIAYGLPVFNIVGLPEITVKESKERLKSAINNSGYTFPMDRVTINLAPADVKKEGTSFDLPMAMGILSASEVISSKEWHQYLVVGELSLGGRVRPVRAVLPYALVAKENGFKGIIVPEENKDEAAIVKGIDIFPVKRLSQLVDFFAGKSAIPNYTIDSINLKKQIQKVSHFDFEDVKGQNQAKRALEIAAAGGHHLLMTGPPGSGKSMMAKRLNSILPDLTLEETLEVTRIYSVVGAVLDKKSYLTHRPFRNPHHTISDAGLAGGGSRPEPGEISLAHNGVLFLDELPEFKRNTLEVLRQPLEDGSVTIARAGSKATYPASFMLVAAMNPCPCGYLGDPIGRCNCTPARVKQYRSKISGPLLDRIDICVEVPKIKYKELRSKREGEGSTVIKKRVKAARRLMQIRLKAAGIFCNARMQSKHLHDLCPLTKEAESILELAVNRFGLSARACHSIIKVARTIADLDRGDEICRQHVAEAIQYKSFDRMV